MRRGIISILILAIILLLGCAGGGLVPGNQPAELQPLAGSSLDGVELILTDQRAVVNLAQASPDGTFLRLATAPGQSIRQLAWSADGVLAAAFAVDGGAEIGVVALADYQGGPVSLELELVSAAKTTSVPPVGIYNTVKLEIADAGQGLTRLSWVQVNTGDYNFDGLVGVADLTPIGQLFNHSYSRTGLTADLQREYWVDGNSDGVINVSDITPIGQNYGAFIAGYNVSRFGETLGDGNAPTVPATMAQPRNGLPCLYDSVFPGAPGDDWAVVSVDGDGVEGSGSGGIVGDVNLRANIDISGIYLFDLTGANSGPFEPSKFGARVIDPIEIIDNARFDVLPVTSQVTYIGTQANFAGLPPGQTLFLDIFYLPAVDLATGAPRTPASLKGARAVDDSEFVITSLPFMLPAEDELVEVELEIEIIENPAGGYFVEITAVVLMPGDDPATPAVESGYTLTYRIRLAYKSGLLSSDTDGNGDFEDEAELSDDDRDGVSESRREQEFDDDQYEDNEREELEIEGIISAFDEAAGTITLTGAQFDEGDGEALPDPLVLEFSELTQFEERVRTDDDDIEQDIDPSELTLGDEVEVELYRLDDTAGGLPVKYWIEKIDRVLDLRTE